MDGKPVSSVKAKDRMKHTENVAHTKLIKLAKDVKTVKAIALRKKLGMGRTSVVYMEQSKNTVEEVERAKMKILIKKLEEQNFSEATKNKLRNYNLTGVMKHTARASRALFLRNVNDWIERNDDASFKATFSINILVYQEVCRSFIKFYNDLDARITDGTYGNDKQYTESEKACLKYTEFVYWQYRDVVFTKGGELRLAYTHRIAILVLFAFMSGEFISVFFAIKRGFQNAGKLRSSCVYLLSLALKKYHPIKVRLNNYDFDS